MPNLIREKVFEKFGVTLYRGLGNDSEKVFIKILNGRSKRMRLVEKALTLFS